jgi:DNA-binding NarL/FixJ family response regulator
MAADASLQILLIDGNHKDRQYYAHRLKLASPEYEVFEAADGRSGLHLYHTCFIDCVILEINLPDMSGFEVLVNLAPLARSPEVAVIILTQLTSQALLELAIKNGAQAALHKSSTSGDILDKAVMKAISTVQRPGKWPSVIPETRLDDSGTNGQERHEPGSGSA